jgi:hypothetical protein
MSGANARARIAEQRLFELASELRFVPIDGRATRTHLRALELKREVRSWESRAPDEARMNAVLDELRALSLEARQLRSELRTGDSDATVASTTRPPRLAWAKEAISAPPDAR